MLDSFAGNTCRTTYPKTANPAHRATKPARRPRLRRRSTVIADRSGRPEKSHRSIARTSSAQVANESPRPHATSSTLRPSTFTSLSRTSDTRGSKRPRDPGPNRRTAWCTHHNRRVDPCFQANSTSKSNTPVAAIWSKFCANRA